MIEWNVDKSRHRAWGAAGAYYLTVATLNTHFCIFLMILGVVLWNHTM